MDLMICKKCTCIPTLGLCSLLTEDITVYFPSCLLEQVIATRSKDATNYYLPKNIRRVAEKISSAVAVPVRIQVPQSENLPVVGIYTGLKKTIVYFF